MTSGDPRPSFGKFSPEFQLLLACGRLELEPRSTHEIERLLASELDLSLLLAVADRHRVLPLLHRHLVGRFSKALPAPFRQELTAQATANAARNLQLFAELKKLLTALETRGVASVPFKGPVLALAVYGDLGLRQFCDLDVLIRRPDLPAAIDILRKLGYQPGLEFGAAEQRIYLANACEFPLLHPDSAVLVELQWRFAPRHFSLRLDADTVWPRTMLATFGGTAFRTLSPEDLLLVLSVHGGKHGWERLGWICDLAQLIRSYPALDWEMTWRRAQKIGAVRLLALGLFLADRLLAAPLPEQMRHKLAGNPVLNRLADDVERKLTSAVASAPTLPDHILLARARERWRDRVAYLLRVVFTPGLNDCAAVPLPAALAPAYHLVRPGRILLKALQRQG
jgi:hypothetical protein